MTLSTSTRITSEKDGAGIAALIDSGVGPTIFWLGGYRSDMTGSKAEALSTHARAHGQAMVRFDYFGHGQSDGDFHSGTISRWLDDAETVFRKAVTGPVLLVGSSMGGWLALLLARRLAGQGTPAAGIVLIAPAPDFTEALIYEGLSPDEKISLHRDGKVVQPSDIGEPDIWRRDFIEDGRTHLLLTSALTLDGPVTILQGKKDDTVPWTHALKLVDRLVHDDVTLTLIPDGDHRLSRPEDIERLISAVDQLSRLA